MCEATDAQKDLKCQVESLTEQLHELRSADRAAKAEQEQICAMLHPPPSETSCLFIVAGMMSCPLYIEGGSGDLEGRLVELSTQKEDLQYQLSCCQGQLETHIQRAETAEVKPDDIILCCHHSNHVCDV